MTTQKKAALPKKKRPDVTLTMFHMDLLQKLADFEEMWRKKHEKDPENWPMQFEDSALMSGLEQWAEQFRAWMGWDE